MKHLKKWIFSPFRTDWKLLAVFSVPAVLVGLFGLSQLEILSWGTALAESAAKFLCEFLFLGILLSLLNLLGLKNKWILGILAFFYFIAVTADGVLLWYFKERFGKKYLDTLQGGDYDFMTDWRLLSYFTVLALFCLGCIFKFFRSVPRKTALHRLAVCAAGTLLLYSFNPLALLPAPLDFYTAYLMPPSLVYTARAVLAKSPAPVLTATLDKDTAALAQHYNVFTARQTPAGKNYKRVILIASESLSNKYMHRFNPNIPPAASAPLDKLYETYPSASLRHVSLSTLYGLSVIFTSHPFVKLAYENNYPVSLVKELKKHGFHTAFLRGANETYMDEHILFKQAGFDEVIGATYFARQPQYQNYINWWGLLDRKLFDYAADYLQAHRDEPVFVTLLTLDSHVPLGRPDYAGETYEEIDNPFYKTPTMPRAFARFGQDVARFLARLAQKGLFDEETLVLITPDHPSYSNTPTNALFKPFDKQFDNLPFIIVTKTRIDAPVTTDTLASQLDIAPTVLDLLNLDIPRGMFGHSLFDLDAPRSVFDIKEDYAVVTTAQDRQIIPLNSKRPQDQSVLTLMRTFVR